MSPQVKVYTPAGRAAGVNVSTWTRLNGDGILLPDDLLEGAGNLSDINQDGQPDQIEIVSVDQPDTRNVLIGSQADTVTRQNPSGLPIEQSSYLVNHPLVAGDLPSTGMTARMAPPGKPTIKLEPASKAGYPEATPERPFWLAFGYRKGNERSPMGPPVSFTGGQGQSYRVTLPQDNPETVTGLDIYMTEPGTSTASRPGTFRIQATLDLLDYAAPTYDLIGPFLYGNAGSDEGATGTKPRAPKLIHLADVRQPARVGIWTAVCVYTTRTLIEAGEWWKQHPGRYGDPEMMGVSEPSGFSESITIEQDSSQAGGIGLGPMKLVRPTFPPEAKGWVPYIAFQGQIGNPTVWGNLYTPPYGGSIIDAYPLSYTELTFNGFTPGQRPSGNFTSGSFPANLGSPAVGIGAPDSPPEKPIPFGASRPGPGKYFVRVTEEARGLETAPSLPESADIGDADIMRIEFFNRKNRLPNATLREKDASGLPTSYTIDQTGGYATMESGELVVGTTSATSGTTPSVFSASVSMNPAEEWSLSVPLKMSNPKSGGVAGQVELVLRETSSTGTTTDTVLYSLSAPGARLVKAKILATGSTGTYVWQSTTTSVQLFYRFTGASKNATMRISQQVLKGYGWFFRRRERTVGLLSSTNITPETTIPPGADVSVEPPPPSFIPPEGTDVQSPDRMQSPGTTLETANFESGSPSGWVQHTSGGGGITFTAGAALSGSTGMRLLKSSGGSSSAYISKQFSPPLGLAHRHSLAAAASYKVPSLSSGGYFDFHALARADGTRFGYLRYSKAVEIAQLTIDSPPTRPGSVTVNLDGTSTNIAVTAVQQVETLTLSATPTASGTVKITLDGVAYNVTVGDTRERFTIRIDGQAVTTGFMTLQAGGATAFLGVGKYVTTNEVAAHFAKVGLAGYTVEAVGNTVTYLANLPGPKADPVLDTSGTNLPYTMTVEVQGETNPSLASLATRLRAMSYDGWVTGGSGDTITWTSVQAKARASAAYDPGTTGATGTMSTTTTGVSQTAASLASAIRSTSFTGWTTGGSGSVVTFTANTVGNRQNAYYDPQATEAAGTMVTLAEGSNGDVLAIIKDADGIEQHRTILSNAATAQFNVDVSVGGADAADPEGTPLARGILNFWIGTGAKTLRARFEDVDLTDYPAAEVQVGVVSDDGVSTWEVYADDVAITDLGLQHFNDLDYYGRILNQLYYHGPPDQPPNDVPIKDYRRATMPGTLETWGARVRYDGVAGARPLMVTGLTPEGDEIPIGEIASQILSANAEPGITGTADWFDARLQYTVPANVYEIKLASENVGVGEIVIQEIACSAGDTLKRTPFYAASGAYRATLDTSTPEMPDFAFWGRERKLLTTLYDTPSGTNVVTQYRGGSKQSDGSILWDTGWESDPAMVRETNHLQADSSLTGNGILTPVIRSSTPVADYRLLLAGRNLANFLKADASEFPGGAILEHIEEWEDLSEIIIHEKPGGDFDRTALHDPVRTLPPCTLYLFSPAGRRYLGAKWGLENFIIEDEGTAIEVKLRGVEVARKTTAKNINDETVWVYEAKIAGGVVLSVTELG